jgi:hypothetical protein
MPDTMTAEKYSQEIEQLLEQLDSEERELWWRCSLAALKMRVERTGAEPLKALVCVGCGRGVV